MPDNREIIESFLKKRNQKYTFDEELLAFDLDVKTESLIFPVTIVYGDHYVVVLARVPLLVDDKKKNDISELLHRINNSLISGSFDMDYDRGSIDFRSGTNLIGFELTSELIEYLFFNAALSMDSHIKVISQVLSSNVKPIDALKIFEATT